MLDFLAPHIDDDCLNTLRRGNGFCQKTTAPSGVAWAGSVSTAAFAPFNAVLCAGHRSWRQALKEQIDCGIEANNPLLADFFFLRMQTIVSVELKDVLIAGDR